MTTLTLQEKLGNPAFGSRRLSKRAVQEGVFSQKHHIWATYYFFCVENILSLPIYEAWINNEQ